MMSISVKLPDGSKSLVRGESLSDIWNTILDAPMAVNDIPTTGYVNNVSCGSSSGVSTNTLLTTTSGTNSTTLWYGGSAGLGVSDLVYRTRAVPAINLPWWGWGEDYPIFQKLPTEFCSNPSSPPVDIYRGKDNELHYLWAVAGYALEDISIEFEDGYLLLTLDKKETKEPDKSRTYITKGIKSGKIENKYFVGDKYDTGKAVAKLKEGILEVTIQMKEEEKPVKVKITKE